MDNNIEKKEEGADPMVLSLLASLIYFICIILLLYLLGMKM